MILGQNSRASQPCAPSGPADIYIYICIYIYIPVSILAQAYQFTTTRPYDALDHDGSCWTDHSFSRAARGRCSSRGAAVGFDVAAQHIVWVRAHTHTRAHRMTNARARAHARCPRTAPVRCSPGTLHARAHTHTHERAPGTRVSRRNLYNGCAAKRAVLVVRHRAPITRLRA